MRASGPFCAFSQVTRCNRPKRAPQIVWVWLMSRNIESLRSRQWQQQRAGLFHHVGALSAGRARMSALPDSRSKGVRVAGGFFIPWVAP